MKQSEIKKLAEQMEAARASGEPERMKHMLKKGAEALRSLRAK